MCCSSVCLLFRLYCTTKSLLESQMLWESHAFQWCIVYWGAGVNSDCSKAVITWNISVSTLPRNWMSQSPFNNWTIILLMTQMTQNLPQCCFFLLLETPWQPFTWACSNVTLGWHWWTDYRLLVLNYQEDEPLGDVVTTYFSRPWQTSYYLIALQQWATPIVTKYGCDHAVHS